MPDISVEQIVDRIGEMTILEINDLVKAIEEKYEVSAAPVAVASAGAPGAEGPARAEEEKDSFNVVLKEFPSDAKIKVIKEVRAITGLGLKEAKELVEGAPKEIKEDVTKDVAAELKKQLEAVGATVELT